MCRLAVLAVLACKKEPQEQRDPVIVQARDTKGEVVAELRPGHPCRATIGPIEMLIGGPPLVAQVGNVRWTGKRVTSDVTELARDGQAVGNTTRIGAIVTVTDVESGSISITMGNGVVTAHQRDRVESRFISGTRDTIVTGDITITGTGDAALAAALVAPELRPEIRMLAACERVLQ